MAVSDKKKDQKSQITDSIELKEPINHGDELIEFLQFRKPVARDFREMGEKVSMGDILDLAAKLSNQPESVINRLCVEDMKAVVGIVSNFM